MDGRRVDLERARREAKALLRAARARDHVALARLRGGGSPRLRDLGGDALLERARLADAQMAIAREQGARSWPGLVRMAEAQVIATEDRAARFVTAATEGRRDRADALLALDRWRDPRSTRRSCTGRRTSCARP